MRNQIDKNYQLVKTYKTRIKEKTKIAAFAFLQSKQKLHSKVTNIKYTKLETQGYITSPIFTDKEVSLLFALRSMCVKVCKANFSSQYKQTQDILCTSCNEKKVDNQQHVLECKELLKHLKSEEVVKEKILYTDIFEDTVKQKNITTLFAQLMVIKNNKSENKDPSTPQSLDYEVLKTSYNVQSRIASYSFGK